MYYLKKVIFRFSLRPTAVKPIYSLITLKYPLLQYCVGISQIPLKGFSQFDQISPSNPTRKSAPYRY